MKEYVTACIDGSAISASVCDTAAWASARLKAPLRFIHVLEKPVTPAAEDLSGAIGLGSREHLLEELIALDEQRGKLAIEHGKHMLADARERASELGVEHIDTEQRHGGLLETLTEYEESTRLFIIGRQGEGHDGKVQTIGSRVESVVRAIHTPILVAVDTFQAPGNFLIAYDGSDTADKAIERIASSPLLKEIQGYIVTVGADNEDNRKHLEYAASLLRDTGHQIETHLIQGEVIEVLEKFQQGHQIELKVMGAYGHSRIREFFVGSNTSKMISSSQVPLLLLR
jgi:nucleotide-binding universal stress UspA family protein